MATKLSQTSLYTRFIYVIALSYLVTVSVYMLWHRAWFSPDQFFGFAIVAALLLGRTREFIWDWVPILLLLFGYEYLRGIIPILTSHSHVLPMIIADQSLFGFIPTIKLQTLFFNESALRWYDYMAVILYISHFVIPMFVAFILWIHNRSYFRAFSASVLVLSYLAFITFIIFPAVPPWMASDQGYLPPLKKIMDQVLASFSHPIRVPSVYEFFGADLVAAIPSLHAAYPWLIFLFILKKWKLISLLLLPYVFGVWFAVVYLGEHYVVDVIAGIIYATVAYFIIQKSKRLVLTTSKNTVKVVGYD